MNKNNFTINFFIGLPGSGKTCAAKELLQSFLEQQILSENLLFLDELYLHLKQNHFDWHKTFSISHNDIEDLQYKHIIITDFLACDPKQQSFILEKLQSLFPQYTQTWHFFDNNPEQCAHNIKQRNNGKNVSVTLFQMAKIYQVSNSLKEKLENIIYHQVYSQQEHLQTYVEKKKPLQ